MYHGKYCSRACQQMSKPVKKGKRKYELRTKFNLTPDQYQKMLEAQNGVCAICGKSEKMKMNGVVKRLSVDHDHKTGTIRGLLCNSCNNGLGNYQDSPDLLTKAIDYLTSHTSQEA